MVDGCQRDAQSYEFLGEERFQATCGRTYCDGCAQEEYCDLQLALYKKKEKNND